MSSNPPLYNRLGDRGRLIALMCTYEALLQFFPSLGTNLDTKIIAVLEKDKTKQLHVLSWLSEIDGTAVVFPLQLKTDRCKLLLHFLKNNLAFRYVLARHDEVVG